VRNKVRQTTIHHGALHAALVSSKLIPQAHALNTFIVEDSPVILEKLVTTLEELTPVTVVGTAADERNAVDWLQQPGHKADLLIIDIFLKSGSGLGVLRSVNQLALPAKRVVLTNYATAEMREACRRLGADRIFDKSSELEELLAYCERLGNGADSVPGDLN
jgi:DNA-binding NarL/FixJ family response regulator